MKKYKNALWSAGLYITAFLFSVLFPEGIDLISNLAIVKILLISSVAVVFIVLIFGIFFAQKSVRYKETSWLGVLLTVLGILMAIFYLWFLYAGGFFLIFD
jgi:hypothetical protein